MTMRRYSGRAAHRWALIFVGLALPLSTAEAAPKKKVALGYFDGESGQMLADAVSKALKRRVDLVDNEAWIATGNRIGALLVTPDGKKRVLAELGAVAVIEGNFARQGKRWVAQVVLTIPGGKSPPPLEIKNKSRRRILQNVRRQVWRKFRTSIQKAPVPAASTAPPPAPVAKAPEPPPSASTKVAPASSTEAAPSSADVRAEAPRARKKRSGLRSESPVDVFVGFQWGARIFDYTDPLIGGLRPYESFGVPAVNARLTWYPGSHFSDNVFARHIGLDVALSFALGLGSELDDGSQSFDTSANRFTISAKGRMPLGRHEIALLAGFAQESFTIEADNFFPSISYSAIRAGLTGRVFVFEDIYVSPEFGWRFIVGSGDIGGDEWFPNAAVGGLDFGVMAGMPLFWRIEAQAHLGYRHYFFSMNPEVGDARVAGGALDQFINLTAGLAFYLD